MQKSFENGAILVGNNTALLDEDFERLFTEKAKDDGRMIKKKVKKELTPE